MAGGIIEPFDMYPGYGDDAPLGFMADSSTFTPEYKGDLSAVGDVLDDRDWNGAPRGRANADQVIHDLAAKHGLDPNQVYWDVLNQPKAHELGWRGRDGINKDWGAYNWAYTTDPYPADTDPNTPPWSTQVTSPQPPHGPVLPTGADPAAYLEHHYLGRRLAYERQLNVDSQRSKLRARAAEARASGDHELADYIEGLQDTLTRDAEAGRPEGWKHYLPMAAEEFGDERVRAAVPHHQGSVDREFLVALREAGYLELTALQQAPGEAAEPEMDWDPVMKSVADTGGYSIGDAGESPTSGYMISLPGTEERRPTDTVTPATEGDYHKRHWDRLREDPDLYQGGWDDEDTFYTDLSRNDDNLWRTIGDAVTTDQLGIYDLNHHQTLDTSDDPDTDRDDYNPLLTGFSPMASRRLALEQHLVNDERPRTLPPKKLRQQQEKFKQPAEALDPTALDPRIDIDALVKNALSRYHGATPEQREGGRNWYNGARLWLQNYVKDNGGDYSRAAAIMAGLSPQLSWEKNLEGGAHFLKTYRPEEKHLWRTPNVSPDALAKWQAQTGGIDRGPQTPEEWNAFAQMAGNDDPEWLAELQLPGRWDTAVAKPSAKGPYTGTGLPMLGDNVLRAMALYDAKDPRDVMGVGGPKIDSFWHNFLGDENYVTIDKHMLRALDRGYGEDPLMSYGKKPAGVKTTPEDERVAQLEAMLGYKQNSITGDEPQTVNTGYNSYVEAIRRATAQVNAGLQNPADHVTPAQMQAIIWLQHKSDMDAFTARKSKEEWEAKNPGKSHQDRRIPKPGLPVTPKVPMPNYEESDAWAEAHPYKGPTKDAPNPRPKRDYLDEQTVPPVPLDNIPDSRPSFEDMYVGDPHVQRAAAILFGL